MCIWTIAQCVERITVRGKWADTHRAVSYQQSCSSCSCRRMQEWLFCFFFRPSCRWFISPHSSHLVSLSCAVVRNIWSSLTQQCAFLKRCEVQRITGMKTTPSPLGHLMLAWQKAGRGCAAEKDRLMKGSHARLTHMHHWKGVCEGGGRDDDSPATIYLFWLSWLHSQRPELLDTEAGMGRGRDAGKAWPSLWLPRLSFRASANWTWCFIMKKKNVHSAEACSWSSAWLSHPDSSIDLSAKEAETNKVLGYNVH